MESPRVNAESGPGKQHSRQAIFDAAKRLFAEKGFAGTSIREITSEAGCNLAAVNYYFHGKDKLYLEVLTQTLVEFREELISSISEVKRRDCPPTLESLLRSFAQAFLKPFVMGQQQLLKLLIHEMTNRRLPEGLLFKEVIEPVETTLIKVLKQLCPEIDNACARRCISSVVAQLIHAVHSQRLFSDRLERRQGDFDLPGTVAHIVCFSAAGIRARCKEKL